MTEDEVKRANELIRQRDDAQKLLERARKAKQHPRSAEMMIQSRGVIEKPDKPFAENFYVHTRPDETDQLHDALIAIMWTRIDNCDTELRRLGVVP